MESLGLTAEFYFPIEDNDGRGLKQEYKDFKASLALHYDGYTQKAASRGTWIDYGKEFDEYHQIIEVSSPKLTPALIEALARDIKRSARQIAVYFKIDGKAFLV